VGGDSGDAEIGLTVLHAMALRTLPAIHRDPFDRMLIAQTLTEGLQIVTCDPEILKYPVPRIVA
jgi:PIN domain nuclease of toxin-antitoxin system